MIKSITSMKNAFDLSVKNALVTGTVMVIDGAYMLSY